MNASDPARLRVYKFGGTSVASTEHLSAIAQLVAKDYQDGARLVVVVSAMAGETDRLQALARTLCPKPSPRELDALLSTGEQITMALLALALHALGCPARSCTGGQARIRTDHRHNRARIKNIDGTALLKALQKDHILVVAGFQGIDEEGNITTLGRGGSDITAVALAVAIGAGECRIYTDVDGVYTADPRIVPEARRLAQLSHEEMLELSALGARVLQTRAVEFASKYNVPLRVLSSFDPGPGTLISTEEIPAMEQPIISGIAHNRDEAKLTLIGVPDQPGIAHKILGPIATHGIEVDMIVQNIGQDNTTDFTFTVHRRDYEKSMDILRETATQLGARDVRGDNAIIKISVVGVGMRSHAGIASRMFAVLAEQNINIMMISTSEIKISVVIEERYLETGVRALHQAFDLEQKADPLPRSASTG